MEKEFVPYEQALALKELGFDEPCFGFCRNDRQDKKLEFTNIELAKNYNGINSKDLFIAKNEDLFLFVSRPTFSQAFRWFREKHNLSGFIGTYSKEFVKDNKSIVDGQYYLYISPIISGDSYIEYFDSYKEAELACLDKLIEIVKTKN